MSSVAPKLFLLVLLLLSLVAHVCAVPVSTVRYGVHRLRRAADGHVERDPAGATELSRLVHGAYRARLRHGVRKGRRAARHVH